MVDCKALAGLWLDAATVAVLLLIYIHCTTNGEYKRPQVCLFQTVGYFRTQLQMMRKHGVK